MQVQELDQPTGSALLRADDYDSRKCFQLRRNRILQDLNFQFFYNFFIIKKYFILIVFFMLVSGLSDVTFSHI